jgi:HAD superfamily hydrolase (TIGR01509 family)
MMLSRFPAQLAFDAVLFDCDGVLVDSEPITIGVLRDMFDAMGWRMTLAQAMQQFVGHSVKSQADLIAQKTGVRIDAAWLESFWLRRDEALAARVVAIEGVREVLAWIQSAKPGAMAVASGADRRKVELVLKRAGLLEFFEGRIFTGHELPRTKPAPDVYLAAAAALGVDPKHCAVIEDSPVGVQAGVAAGATVFGYVAADHHFGENAMRQAGCAVQFDAMQKLPLLLASKHV